MTFKNLRPRNNHILLLSHRFCSTYTLFCNSSIIKHAAFYYIAGKVGNNYHIWKTTQSGIRVERENRH